MSNAWFIADPAADPYYNMACDEWMLIRVMMSDPSVIVRLYSWYPGAITIGVNQTLDRALDRSQVGQTPVIRRPTGGRALYHDPAELTYSVAVNTNEVSLSTEAGSIAAAGRWVAEVLLDFLQAMGVTAEAQQRSSSSMQKPLENNRTACFDSHARYELVREGRKLVASAQRRIGPAFLQHGSIKLHGAVSHPALLLRSGKAKAAAERPPNMDQFDQAVHELRVVFQRHLDIGFQTPELTSVAREELRARREKVFRSPLSKRDIG